MKFFNHPEGYVEPDGNGGYTYVYQYKDHLGNVRLSYADDNNIQTLVNDKFDSETGNWSGSVSNENGRLKVLATGQYSGTTIFLGDNFTAGEKISLDITFDTGNTDIVRRCLIERDNNGNTLGYYQVDSDIQTGSYSFNHNIVAGTKLYFRFDKSNVSSDVGTPTYFYVDDVSVTRGELEIREENNYYPFGLKHKGYNDNVSAFNNGVASKWKYNGKELNESLGFNLYEMDMRSYDPAIAKWTGIDPITHYSMSPYNAFDNNPVFWADPSGADAITLFRSLWSRSGSGLTQYTNTGNGTFEETARVTDDGGSESNSQQNCPNCKTLSDYFEYYSRFFKSPVTQRKIKEGLDDTEKGVQKALLQTVQDASSVKTFEISEVKESERFGFTAGIILFALLEPGPGGEFRSIKSLVKTDPKLIKFANETFQGNKALSREANGLIEQLSRGNMNPGIGTKNIGNNIFEARSRGGARVYFRNTAENSIEILGYSSKNNQQSVINHILKTFE